MVKLRTCQWVGGRKLSHFLVRLSALITASATFGHSEVIELLVLSIVRYFCAAEKQKGVADAMIKAALVLKEKVERFLTCGSTAIAQKYGQWLCPLP